MKFIISYWELSNDGEDNWDWFHEIVNEADEKTALKKFRDKNRLARTITIKKHGKH